jgi:isopentenyl-diphosphate delta-isomerase type 1
MSPGVPPFAEPVGLPAFPGPDYEERIILVDGRDQEYGTGGKLEVHQQGLLHRAFSIFIFDTQEKLLLQRRADGKYHFARLWSNSCCGASPPRRADSGCGGAAAGRGVWLHHAA